MAGIAWIIALATLAGGTPSADPLAAFDAALAAGDQVGASRVYNQALDTRIAARRTGPEPMLAEMQARIVMIGGGGTAEMLALVQLARTAAAPPRADGLLLLEARIDEALGLLPAAEAAYRQAASSRSAAVAEEARLGIARRLLDRDPAGARGQLAELDAATDPDVRWEAALLRSRAAALAGDDAAARSELATAWSLVLATRDPVGAAHRTARDRALGASRPEQAALAPLEDVGGAPGELGLPACDATVRPEDSAVVEVARWRDGLLRFSIVRASRPGVAAAFVAQAAATAALGKATLFTATVRCTQRLRDLPPRALVSSGWALARWIAARGLYARLPTEGDDGEKAIAEQRDQLDALRKAYGAASVETLVALNTLARLEQAQAIATANPVYLSHARAHLEEAARIAAASDMPVDGMAALRLSSESIPEDTSLSPAQLGERSGTLLLKAMEGPEVSADFLAGAIANTRDRRLSVTDRLAVLDRVRAGLTVRHLDARDPRLRAVAVRRAALLQEAGTPEVGTQARQAGIAADFCQATDIAPRVANNDAITSEDYPKELLAAAAQGVVQVEYDVDTVGRVPGQRVIVATPPGLFEGATAAAMAKLRFDPARTGGKAVGCRAELQRFRWQVPNETTSFERAMERMPGG